MKKILLLLFIAFVSLQQMYSANYYWVGGAGNWSDINHWAQNSGGNTLHTVVPQTTDDVIFDNNSGFVVIDSVYVDVSVATCKNMFWYTNVLTSYKITGNIIHIYGSLLLQANVSLQANVVMLANGNTNITTNGAIVKANITKSGTGNLQLLDSLFSTHNFAVSNGTFNLNGFNFTIEDFTGSNLASINITNAMVKANNWKLTGVNTLVQAANSLLLLHKLFDGQDGHLYNNVTFVTGANLSNNFSGSVFANSLVFASNGIINGNNTFGTLKFVAGFNYKIAGGSIQKINNFLDANTSLCSGLMEIFSSNNVVATFNITNTATVQIANAILKNIRAIGSNLPIVANNSFDFGNNTNLIFSTATGTTLYWVGGAGNWNDKQHWSTINNGIYPSTTGCIPTPLDDVVFNNNAGFTAINQSIFLNIANQYCKNILWQNVANVPTITGSKLTVFGSFTLQPNMSYNVAETYFQSNNISETITSNGTIVNSDLYFEGNSEWQIMDALDISQRAIFFKKGAINTNSNLIKGASFTGSSTNGQVKLTLGASQIFMINSWAYTGVTANTILNAGTSHIHIGGFFKGAFSHLYYDISFVNANFTSTLDGSIFARNVDIAGNATISGNNQFANLTFAPAKIYVLLENATQTITNNWSANTPICSGLMEIKSTNSLQQTFIKILPSATALVGRVLFQSVNIDNNGSMLIAPNCYDFGNNTNIVFPAATTSTLYWVGGAGNWNDKQHWSTINNGIYPSTTGCVPTPLDNIVFNSNSGFTNSNNVINANMPNLYCNNITWQGVASNALIIGVNSDLHIFGSIQLQSTAQLKLLNIFLLAKNTTINVNANGAQIDAFFIFKGNANWQLGSNLIVEKAIRLLNGNLTSNSYTIQASTFEGTPTFGNIIFNVANSTIKVNSWAYAFNTNAQIINIKSNIYTNSFIGAVGNIYYNIIIDSIGSVEGSIIANKIWFKGAGNISGSNVVDTLIFTFGKTYVLQKNATQTIHKIWYPNGNPCFITRITSSEQGVQTNIKLNYTPAVYDYIYVKDINAASSISAIIAQSHSTNDGNNTNINFVPYNNNGINGLGNDTVVNCTNFPINLVTNNFYPNPVTTFVWQNASTNSNFIVQDSGNYNVIVNYGEGCIVRDTLKVTRTNIAGIKNIQAAICNNQNYILPSGVVVQTAGIYNDTITNTIGCDSIITTTLSVKASNTINENKIICQGENYTLPNGQVVTQPGVYTSSFLNTQGCDSLIVTNIQMQSMQHLQITPTQNVCFGNAAQLNVSGANNYIWTPNSSLNNAFIKNPIATPTTTTTYSVIVTDSICNITSNLQTQVIVNASPNILLQKTNDLDCNNTTAILSCNTNLQNFVWTPNVGLNNYNQSSVIAQPATTTTYTVMATGINGCSSTQSIEIKVLQRAPNLPVPNIFTPNNDGVNDCFSLNYWASISQYELNIYNRWGQKVFYTNNLQQCWNGKFNSIDAPLGTYVYYIKAYDECSKNFFTKKGTVILAR